MNPHRLLYGCSGGHFEAVSAIFVRRAAPSVVEQARTSGELLDRLSRNRRFDAILLDLELPTLGALRLVQLVSAIGYPAPILVLSEHGDRAAAEAVKSAGAADFVVRRSGYADAMPRICQEAIERFRTQESAQESARRQAEMDILLSLQRRLNTGSDLWATCGMLAEQLVQNCPYDQFTIWISEDDGYARAAFVAGKDNGVLTGDRRSLAGTFVARAIAGSRTIATGLNDWEALPRELVAAAVAPLSENGTPAGAIEIASATVFYDESHLRILGAISEQISAALGQAARRREEDDEQRQRVQMESARQISLAVSKQLDRPLAVLTAYMDLLRTQDLAPHLLTRYLDEADRAVKELTARVRQFARVAEAASTTLDAHLAIIELESNADDLIEPSQLAAGAPTGAAAGAVDHKENRRSGFPLLRLFNRRQ